jgi:lantibiotic modifying enzyme
MLCLGYPHVTQYRALERSLRAEVTYDLPRRYVSPIRRFIFFLQHSSVKFSFSQAALDACYTSLAAIPIRLLLPTNILFDAVTKIRCDDSINSTLGREKSTYLQNSTLAHLIDIRLHLSCVNILMAFRRLESLLPELSMFVGQNPSVITDVQFLGDETHNGGQQPVLIEFDNRQRIKYIPTSVSTHLAFSQVVSILNRDLQWKIRAVKVVPGSGAYGFADFITNDPIGRSSEAPDRYYYRVGALAGMAYYLNITDLHMENVVASGEYPVLIDLECLFYRYPQAVQNESVLHTGLVQRQSAAIALRSGIQGGGLSPSFAPHAVCEKLPYPEMRYRKMCWHVENRVCQWPNGLIDPVDYVDDIITGFRDAHRCFKSSITDIRAALEAVNTQQRLRIRHLLRFTSYYVLHLAWLMQPSFTQSYNGELNRLRSDEMAGGHPTRRVLAAERQDLLRGDVPYFWSYAASRHLFHGSGIVSKNYFSTTAIHAVTAKLSSASDESCDVQTSAIREALSR